MDCTRSRIPSFTVELLPCNDSERRQQSRHLEQKHLSNNKKQKNEKKEKIE